ncbi:MAG: tRNA 2-thiouridine(34) synthase MnmA [Candidatus Absconditabacterales bacterium]
MKKVLVGLSGGVDSAVAAYLLKQQGYDVTAGFMKNYIAPSGNCTTYEDAQEAIKVAKFLGIEILSFDLQKEYNEKIITYIYDGYKKGITPNPDILCNTLIKFDVFLHKALEMGFDYIATGHYAKIETWKSATEGSPVRGKVEKWKLLRGLDHNKDQSYFLAGLDQFQLSKSVFPLGGLTKPEVRALAKKIQLPNADRKDSQGLCFVGNIPIKKFLEQKLPKKTGNIIDMDGRKIGTHDGARFFTLGQRHGLNLPPDRYVTSIDVKKNIVQVGSRDEETLNKKEVNITDRHRIGEEYATPLEITAKIRYRQIPQKAQLLITHNSKLATIIFDDPQRSITPGQVAVAYLDEECIGSGIII